MISKLRHSVTAAHVCIILLLYIVMGLLVSPQHEYPVNDDWIYATSVRQALHGIFTIPDWSQTSQLTHALWGAGFAWIFGFSFTTLTYSVQALGVLGSLTFYSILRRLDLAPSSALLGALLLACNPILVHLSYSFMTDVSFITFMLLACYCYLRGVQGDGDGWLWLGGALSAVALLDRQLGVMIAVAAFVYLLLAGQLNLQRAGAVLALPLLALVGFLIWQNSTPPSAASIYTAAVASTALADPLATIVGRLLQLLLVLPVLGLFVPTLFGWRGRRFIVYCAVLVSVVVWYYSYSHTVSFDASIGNNFDSGGFQPPVLSDIPIITVGSIWFWLALSIIAAVLAAALLDGISAAGIAWWQQAQRQSGSLRVRISAAMTPTHLIYLAAFLVVVPSVVLTAVFDRYFLPLFPAIILFVLRRHPLPRLPLLRSYYIVVGLLLIFSLVAQRDYFAYAGARWAAGDWLSSQGVRYEQIDGGFEWDGWWLYDVAANEIRGKTNVQYHSRLPELKIPFAPDAVIDPIWRLDVYPGVGYQVINRFAYTSWLDGGSQRYVLVIARSDAPKLPIQASGSR